MPPRSILGLIDLILTQDLDRGGLYLMILLFAILLLAILLGRTRSTSSVELAFDTAKLLASRKILKNFGRRVA